MSLRRTIGRAMARIGVWLIMTGGYVAGDTLTRVTIGRARVSRTKSEGGV